MEKAPEVRFRFLPLILGLLLTACGSSFEPGSYASQGLAYHFGADGSGSLTGGVPGEPRFTYEVDGDQVTVRFDPEASGVTFTRIDDKTLQRGDGRNFILQP